jgi:hypothetical protein
MVSLEFVIDRLHCVPGVDSKSNRNEHQEYFLGDKVGRCIQLITLPPSYAVLKSGSLYLLEPSGPVQACMEIALFDTVKVTAWIKKFSNIHGSSKGPLGPPLKPVQRALVLESNPFQHHSII